MSTPETNDSNARQQTQGQKVLVTVLLALSICVFICVLVLWVIPHRDYHPYAMEVKQRAQLKHIETALELFKSEFEKYPPSDAMDEKGAAYCGAMKLSEAVMGRDLLGYHPKSVFRSDGTDGEGGVLYPNSSTLSREAYSANLSARKGRYLPLDYANAYSLADLYGGGNTRPFEPNHYVMCDVFKHVKVRGTRKKVGMPILYYKADTSKTVHDVNDPNNSENIYDYRDNQALLVLGAPGKPGEKHPLYEEPKIFCEIAWDDRANGPNKPYRADSYILLSAGPDGLYGTPDDIANFDFKWKRQE